MRIISREKARTQGLKRYFTGIPCVNNHISERYTSGGCVVCVKQRAIKNSSKWQLKRRLRTQEVLKSISRICKRRLCDTVFTPKRRKNQVFCSERCADTQSKEDWKNRNKEKFRESERIRRNKKYATDEQYNMWIRLVNSLRGRIKIAMKRNNTTKNTRTVELIGCSIIRCKKYLEKQFEDDMSWKNYGKWHIDHIKPCASFDLSKVSEQKKCFNYKNLQPLWAVDNLRKGSKLI